MRIALAGPVTVAQLAPWLDPGEGLPPHRQGGTAVTLLARELLRRGCEIVVASLDPGVARAVVLSGPRLTVHVLPLRARHRARDAYREERRDLEGVLRRTAPDLVHAHWSYEYALAALASRLPTLVTVHDWAPTILRMMPDPYRAVRLGMNVRALAGARYLTAPSPYLAGRLRRWRRPVTGVVPHGLEDGDFDGTERRANRRGAVLVAVNDGFTPWKNVPALLRAFALVRGEDRAVRLVLVGQDHEPGGPAHRWARDRGMDEGVEFLGPLPHGEVLSRLRATDVLVHPSREESFGLVVLEALAQGLPVVAGAASGAVPWLLDGGRAGELTDVNSPRSLAGAIEGLLADPARAAEVGRAGYERAWGNFRIAQVADRYLDVYDQVLRSA